MKHLTGLFFLLFSLSLQAQQVAAEMVLTTDYLVFTPDDLDAGSDEKWPLILFLHGAGERGADVSKVKMHGPPRIVEQQSDFPFIVVSPQCPAGKWWSPFVLNNLLDEILENYPVDEDRVYLTGLSMGGYGTWDLAMESPDRFAAIAPICGGGDPEEVWKLRNMPTWVFHGARDQVVPISQSEDMVNALKAYNPGVKFTVYPEADHDSWTETYDNPELYDWFLSQKRYSPALIELPVERLEKFTGTYRHENGMEMVVTLDNGQLYGQAMGQPRVPLNAETGNDFFIPMMPNIQLQFAEDGKSAILFAQDMMKFERVE